MKVYSPEDRIVFVDRSSGALDQGTVEIRRVDLEAPWRWITAGWADMRRMAHISLIYGAGFAAIAVGMFLALKMIGMASVILALGGGFLLIGPVLAVGLYEGSRRLERGEPIDVHGILLAGFKAPGQLALLGLALLLIYMVWIHTAFLLFMLFLGSQPFPPLEDFIGNLLMTPHGVALLTVGTIEGAALAALVFTICVVSAPMLMERPVGVMNAIRTSIFAVRVNIEPMALWAALVAAFIALGLLTLSVGLIIAFPLIGHATWHAYRDVVGGDR